MPALIRPEPVVVAARLDDGGAAITVLYIASPMPKGFSRCSIFLPLKYRFSAEKSKSPAGEKLPLISLLKC